MWIEHVTMQGETSSSELQWVEAAHIVLAVLEAIEA